MKKAVGGVYIYNLVIVFLLIAFAFVCALLSYTKAFKVSKSISSIIEKSSGYNSVSQKSIEQYLNSIGYQVVITEPAKCPTKNGRAASDVFKGVCIYEISDKNNNKYINYGIVSYMTIDFPIIDLIKVPVYIETERIYVFN